MSAAVLPLPFGPKDRGLPPYSEEAERGLLGSILLHPDVFHDVEGITPDSFFLSSYGLIYKAMQATVKAGQQPDMIGVTITLGTMGSLDTVGGKLAIMNLMDAVYTSDYWEGYAAVIKEKWACRQLMSAGNRITSLALDESSPALARVDQAQGMLSDIADQGETVKAVHVGECLSRTMDRIDNGAPRGVKGAGFYALNDLTGGIFPGNFYVAGGSSGTGKTHFGIAQALDYAHLFPVLFISCEMSEDEITDRALARLSGVDSLDIQNCTLTEADKSALVDGMAKLSALPVHIYAKSNPSEADIRREIRRVARAEGQPPQYVVLDYLQLLRWGHQNRVDDLDHIATTLKGIATDLGITVLALSQVDRGIKNRQNKRPMIQDLVGAGAIENTANRIYLLYRDEKWNPDTNERGIVEINVAKNRSGKEGMVKMLIDLGRSWFGDIKKYGA
jgi:replicative DNA helicase